MQTRDHMHALGRNAVVPEQLLACRSRERDDRRRSIKQCLEHVSLMPRRRGKHGVRHCDDRYRALADQLENVGAVTPGVDAEFVLDEREIVRIDLPDRQREIVGCCEAHRTPWAGSLVRGDQVRVITQFDTDRAGTGGADRPFERPSKGRDPTLRWRERAHHGHRRRSHCTPFLVRAVHCVDVG